MPMYEFFCRHCQKPFSAVMHIKEHDEQPAECPLCHQTKEVEKLISHVTTVTSRKSATF